MARRKNARGRPASQAPAGQIGLRQLRIRFLAKTRQGIEVRKGLGPCLIWTAAKTNGYGSTWAFGRVWRAHRLAWTLFRGEIPAKTCVLHRCDNRACVNVGHLFLGTRADNNRDMVRKGRQKRGPCRKRHPKYRRGRRHHAAKLTPAIVRLIRERAAAGATPSTIAAELGLGAPHVWKVINRKLWSHVE